MIRKKRNKKDTISTRKQDNKRKIKKQQEEADSK